MLVDDVPSTARIDREFRSLARELESCAGAGPGGGGAAPPPPPPPPVGDAVRSYLSEISRVPLLTARQEVILAKRFREGIAATAELDATRGRDDALDRATLTRIQTAGAAAKRRLIEANLRLVVSIVRRHTGRGLDLLDLIQEGNLGLIRAVEKFDHRRGFRFSTYATCWIRQAAGRALADKSRTIRIPVQTSDVIARVARTQRRLYQELGREPTADEIGAQLELTAKRVSELLRVAQAPVSLQSLVGPEADVELGDFIPDGATVAPADAAAFKLLQEQLRQTLRTLTDRECTIIELRFGLANDHPRTLREVGRIFGLTRERIRQIEVKTLAKLGRPSYGNPLRDYLE
jgi:RNA polymerase primary sigma factor